ncbi:MAG: AzlD domain-containing protein [Treponema sp.]|jgi:branched-subunit amino acid transport protein AzlD|nr:AzlD domain-containing protein [Treponema sp.]
MMVSLRSALILTVIMGGVIFFCRVFPFLFFRNRQDREDGHLKSREPLGSMLDFVEKLVPPVAMTVLAFNAISAPWILDLAQGFPALLAAGFTALVHLWKRNALLSICGGTTVYMLIGTALSPLVIP